MTDFSSSSSTEKQVKEIIDQFIADRRGGKAPSIDQIVSQHAHLEERLRRELRRVEILFLVRDEPDKTIVASPDPFATVYEEGGETDEEDLGLETKTNDAYQLKITCPECEANIEVKADTPWTNITCDECNALFSLIGSEGEDEEEKSLSHIGHFELLERVGVGAFGTVWRARDIELQRVVAIKIPRKGLLTASEAKHFLREARAAAQIRHPNIVRVYEIGKFQGRVFIASDFIKGQSLARQITTRRPSIKRAAEMIAKIADALQVAHEAGVIHRDLKPGNILMDMSDEPHITDFGLAKRDSGDITVTMDGAIMGTPAYMSPEQAKGNAHTSDARSDIYSLGVLLFRLLTGELPFRGTTPVLLQQVVNDEPPGPRKFNHLVPRDLDTICLKCLQKNPELRFQSARRLADELTNFLEGKPIVSRPVGSLTRAFRWCLRRRALAAALVGVVLVSLIGAVSATVLTVQANRAMGIASATKNNADQLRREAVILQNKANRQLYASDLNRVQQAVDKGNRLEAMELLRKYIPVGSQVDHRRFEWHYWWRVCNHGAINNHLSSRRLVCVDVSNDDQAVVWGDFAGTIYLSDLEFNNVREFKNCHQSRVADVCFSQDGSQVVSCGDDGALKIWNTETFELIRELPHERQPWYVDFWNEGAWLVIGTEFEEKIGVQVLEFETGRPLDSFAVKGKYGAIALSRDNRHLAVSDFNADGKLVMRDIVNQATRWERSNKRGYDDAVFGPDNKNLIVCTEQIEPAPGEPDRPAVFEVLDIESGETVKIQERRKGVLGISSAQLTKDKSRIIMANGEGSVDVYDALSLQHIITFAGHMNRVMDIGLRHDGNALFSVSDDKSIRQWSLTEPPCPFYEQFGQSISDIQFSPDSRLVAIAVANEIILLSPQTKKVITRKVFEDRRISSLAFSPDGKSIAFTAFNERTRSELLTCTVELEQVQSIEKFEIEAACQVKYIDDSNIALCESYATPWNLDLPVRVLVFEKQDQSFVRSREFGGREQMPDSHHMSIAAWTMSPDGTKLITSSRDRSTKVWNYKTGGIEYSKTRHGTVTPISFVAVSSKGMIAASESTGNIQLWPIDDPHNFRTFVAHDDSVTRMVFSPNGETLFSSAYDGSVKIWDAETGQLRTEIHQGNRRLISLALSPDGRYLASGNDQGEFCLRQAENE